MSYLGSWKIDDLVTFTVNTHGTDGVATDADAAPSYRVYEDETATPILTGTMALLDSANTTGFYSEQITLSAANGFEKGRSYTIYIEATVGGNIGTTHKTLQVEAEVDANIVSDKSGYSISGAITTLDGLNDVSAAEVNAEVDTALADIHLDHLLAVDYDPATPPGVATALLNEIIEDDGGGIARLTVGAVAQVWSVATRVLTANTNLNDPTAAAIRDAILDRVLSGNHDTADTPGAFLQQLDALLSSRAAPADIISDATPFAGANIDAAISTRSSHAASAVLAETLSELTQAQPAATPTLADAIMLLYMAMRNAETQDATEYAVANDAGTVIAKASLSDDGTTVTKGKMVTGP